MSHLRRSLALLVAVLAAGCATGERPSFSTAQSAPGDMTGDPAIDEVLTLLDGANSAQFEADFTILTKFGDRTSDASVTQRATNDRLVSIGTVEYRVGRSRSKTCDTASGECERGIQEARLSDIQITHRFYAEEAAARLRNDARNAIGGATADTAEIAGEPATCVSFPVSGGTPRYCALDSGVLAFDDDADVLIELRSYRSGVETTARN